jgi:hypothetical protein
MKGAHLDIRDGGVFVHHKKVGLPVLVQLSDSAQQKPYFKKKMVNQSIIQIYKTENCGKRTTRVQKR